MNYLIEFEYLAENIDELSVFKGDIVAEVCASEEGWLEGVVRGKRGMFPSNFGKPIQTENNNVAKISDTPYSQVFEEKKTPDVVDESKPQSKKVMGVGFGDIFSGKHIQLKHTNMGESKPQIIEDHQKTETNLDKKVVAGSVGKVELVKAVFAYKAENSDELQIEEGDIITIVDKKSMDEGWWKGKLNNKVGVFPNNFVEPYTAEEAVKPQKPVVAKKNPPPAPLTAKPNIYKPKMTPSRPPNPEPVKVLARNTSVKNVEPELEEVNFDAPINHKPLVGPTSERVRRPNIRLPKKIAQTNNSDDTVTSSEINKIVLTTEKLNESLLLESSITKGNTNKKFLTFTRQKSDESTFPDDKPTISKTGTLKDIFSELVPTELSTKFVPLRDKSKEATDSGFSSKVKSAQERSKETPIVGGSSETVSDKKLHFRTKSQFSSPSLKDQDDQDDYKKKVIAIELRVTAEEKNNASLRKELDELYRTTFDQINDLTSTVNKLSKSFADEKSKRLALEDLVEDLKAKIDELELS